jgi:4-amino-4-deoxy-L-arabinose transferase-like glycosyltransferase
LSETLFTLLVVLACLMIQRLLADGRFLWAVLFGVAAGLGALTRSLLLPIVPLLLLYLCAVLREWKWPRRLALAAAAGAAFFAVVGPWIVRNTRLERTFTTIDCIGGRNLMMGNYEHTPLLRSWDTITMLSGTGRAWDDILMQEHPQFAKLSQGQRDKVAMRHGLRFALAHPGLTLKRSTVKFFDFWQLERTLIAGMKAGWWGDVSRPVLLAAAAVMSGYGAAVLLLAALGFCLTRPRDMRVHWFILLVIVLCAGVHTVIFAHSRYRLPLTPLMIIYSASALCAWRGGQIRWHNWRFAAACAIGMVLVGCWIAQFVVYDMQRFS